MIRPADLWDSMVRVESGGNPNAVGKAGEIGLVQIKPSTAADYGVPKEALYQPGVQRMLFEHIMSKYLDRYGGDPVKAVAAWNAGQGAVDSGKIPLSTQGYLSRVFGGVGPGSLSRRPPMPTFSAAASESEPDEVADNAAPAAAPRPPRPAPPPAEQLPALSDIVQARRVRLAQNAQRVSELLQGV